MRGEPIRRHAVSGLSMALCRANAVVHQDRDAFCGWHGGGRRRTSGFGPRARRLVACRCLRTATTRRRASAARHSRPTLAESFAVYSDAARRTLESGAPNNEYAGRGHSVTARNQGARVSTGPPTALPGGRWLGPHLDGKEFRRGGTHNRDNVGQIGRRLPGLLPEVSQLHVPFLRQEAEASRTRSERQFTEIDV